MFNSPVFEMIINIHKKLIHWEGKLLHTSHTAKIGQVSDAAHIEHRWLFLFDPGQHGVVLPFHDTAIVAIE